MASKKKTIGVVWLVGMIIALLVIMDSAVNARAAQKDGLPFWKTFWKSLVIKLNLKYG